MKFHCWIVLFHAGVIGIATGIKWLSISKTLSIGTYPQAPFYINLCKEGPYLTAEQKKVCQRYYSMMNSVVEGASMAVLECQNQFRNERWNCSTQHRRRRKRSVFGRTLTSGTKESAFVYAVSSAAVAYAITRDCRKGLIDECGCDLSWPHRAQKIAGFEWGGCSDNIAWGEEMSRRFIDVQEHARSRSTRRRRRRKQKKRAKNEISINLNNNRVGRKSVEASMRHQCKCHGISSSCDVMTCWRTLPNFSAVGYDLKSKYNNAVQVNVVRKYGRPFFKSKERLRRNPRRVISGNLDLVYLRKSPDSCATHGRICTPNDSSSNSCSKICCGRGYNTQIRYSTTNCHCKFKWCCEVSCSTCNTTIFEHKCR